MAAAKKKAAKAKNNQGQRECPLVVRITRKERDQFRKLAAAKGLSMSSYGRLLIKEEVLYQRV